MTDSDIDRILRRLDTQDERQREMGRDVREIKSDVKETKADVKETNGRVTKLETDKAVREAVDRDHDKGRERWKGTIIALVTAAVTGGIGALISILAGGHL